MRGRNFFEGERLKSEMLYRNGSTLATSST